MQKEYFALRDNKERTERFKRFTYQKKRNTETRKQIKQRSGYKIPEEKDEKNKEKRKT